jgi:hypothetical protein
MRNFAVIIGVGSILAIGLFLFGLGARNVWRAWRSKSWPTTAATVVTNEMQTSTSTSRSSSEDHTGTMYTANLKFRYQVAGAPYETDLIYLGQTVASGDASEAELRRLRYPLGAQVTVSYDPSHPAVATVHPGFDLDVVWIPVAGLAFLLPGIMAIAFIRSSEGGGGFKFGLVLFLLIFLALGLAMLAAGLVELYRGWRCRTWPTVKGQIVYSLRDTSTTVTHDEEGDTQSTTHSARVIGRYTVNGVVHFSNVRRFGQLSGSDADWADSIYRRYPRGREVLIWYHPDDPDLATLEPGVSTEAWWVPGIGLALLLFATAGLVFGVPALTRFP